jgi:hypothetical protein
MLRTDVKRGCCYRAAVRRSRAERRLCGAQAPTVSREQAILSPLYIWPGLLLCGVLCVCGIQRSLLGFATQ